MKYIVFSERIGCKDGYEIDTGELFKLWNIAFVFLILLYNRGLMI